MSKRIVNGNVWTNSQTPEMKEASKTINRNAGCKCPNCGHPVFFGEIGKGANIEILCQKCKIFFYERKL